MALPSGPVLLLHQAYQQWAELPPVGQACGGSPPIPGLLASYENIHARGVADLAAARAPLSPFLADAGAIRYGRATIGSVPAARWIRRAAPSNRAQWDATTDQALDAQRALHVDGLIIPTVDLTAGAFPNGMQRAIDAARRAARGLRQSDPEAFVRVIVRQEWVEDGSMRRVLLDQLTDLPDALGVALQIRWARRGVLADATTLNSLKGTVRPLVNDGRRVLLVQSGLLGWLALAWGVWGFTAGLSAASWHDTTEQVRRRAGQPSVPRVARYFAAPLLTLLRRDELGGIGAQLGTCSCTFCARLNPLAGGPWDHLLANQHGLYALAELTHAVRGSRQGRAGRVRTVIQAAQQAWASTSQREPGHLQAWLDAL